jgi:hypothetical protein
MPGGQLVVSSVFGNAFSVTDTSFGAYDQFNSIYVFSFGKPPSYIVPGKVLHSFSGNVSKFIGFTELNFPLFDAADAGDPLAPLPPPATVTSADTSNLPRLISLTSGVVTVTGQQCDPDPPNPNNDPNIEGTKEQWRRYNSFLIDGDQTCSAFSNFAIQLPSKSLGTYDPIQSVGKTVQITGMLKNNSGQNPVLDAQGNTIGCDDASPCATGKCIDGLCRKNPFNFWTIIPRTAQDVVVQ